MDYHTMTSRLMEDTLKYGVGDELARKESNLNYWLFMLILSDHEVMRFKDVMIELQIARALIDLQHNGNILKMLKHIYIKSHHKWISSLDGSLSMEFEV
ncbi:hypothetical protein L1887_34104 [Cichorium endivia]|nr:hypothetical protein L1887_34104 [Cichorium endivia]